MKNFSVVILAAGQGTRMKSLLPKVMHKLSGKPLVKWIIDAVSPLKPDNIVIVVGYGHKIVEEYLSKNNIKFVYQEKQLGTAHAVMQAKEIFKNYNGDILVVSGDVPLIKTATISNLIKNNKKNSSSVTILSTEVKDSFGYGRIIRKNGLFERIVEEKDANLNERQIKEINSGIYCFDKNLWKALLKVKPNNAKKEYYITDTIEILKKSGHKVSMLFIKDEIEVKGINSKVELSGAEAILKEQKIKELLNSGVGIIDTNNVYISYDAKIGQDSVIYPGVFIDSGVNIGKKCVLKGSSYIVKSKIADESIISYSYVDGANIGKKVKIGPFAHIRPGSVLKENVKIGNFSETKKSLIEKNSKVNHLSYIGDAQIGTNVNIGAGTITCNYDGKDKHQTIIEQDVFVGSNANIVAPVKIGRGALIAAGSTITHDVPKGKLAIARARQELKRRIKK
ncbi:MAG: bifunctional UDP-N-acetylglucosamine diphosphorylase/glucosamine-1-phosphate N-acetyltransferase GlmU [Endomicrobium sp.]|jgi:bifunctional UDP-N-acetylglucosamine pyrophosphorylase/glucosamine-1-phosphate N-acetyltransferase|uniref:bifunctional UDP-N-acetylglucosamine diphosphorylase/glucosamine-1-phosphate N-acetyltransferase GlmU n=1 Tax=Candidatus Endomicrobiellum cubanum TaxID=3242325 RepID=UPI00282D95EC|nr:bifunctional UDP-N-acetylglucosamine diphosphorylase/glucosamine-1-phosphate N-acetyltransferase GlmU [Endomicrobium sp.]MDR2395353.1 bifunctional UDP-N-acetylglucosamine diphosphorylase/glucosamine-1-phosphate N-acetyltransferase GlmU [Endomicrobium sp.]